jgi:hypothetical protein
MVGKKEDVSDVITNISPTKTPFTSLTGSEGISQILHQWQEDALNAVTQNSQVEGALAVTATAVPTTMRQNNTQIMMDTASVSGTADVVKTYGRDKELAYQLAKKAAQLKRNLEYAMVGTGQTAVLGNDATARVMAGYQAQLDPSVVQTVDSMPLTETLLLNTLETLFINGAEPDNIMLKPSDSTKVAAFQLSAGRTKYIENSDKKVVNVVDVYVSPFGEQKVTINRFQRMSDCLVFEAAMWKRLTLRNWFRETLAKVGDSTQVQIVGEFSLKHKNYFASGLITGLS